MINKCISNCNKCIKSGKDYQFSFFYLFKKKKKDFIEDKILAQEMQEIHDSQIKESISKYEKKQEVIINNKEEKKEDEKNEHNKDKKIKSEEDLNIKVDLEDNKFEEKDDLKSPFIMNEKSKYGKKFICITCNLETNIAFGITILGRIIMSLYSFH